MKMLQTIDIKIGDKIGEDSVLDEPNCRLYFDENANLKRKSSFLFSHMRHSLISLYNLSKNVGNFSLAKMSGAINLLFINLYISANIYRHTSNM